MTKTKTNPVALPKPSPVVTAPPYSYYYSGNVPLMEARFLELCSSIRALYRSVRELREYLLENSNAGSSNNNNNSNNNNSNRNNNNNNINDDDAIVFLGAICENRTLLAKQRAELGAVVEGMRRLLLSNSNGGSLVAIPDDIAAMVLEEDDNNNNNNNNNSNSNEQEQEQEQEHQDDDKEDNNDNDNDNDGPGVYL
eukprot:jgi/Psemu1/48711/gm1.48711_g